MCKNMPRWVNLFYLLGVCLMISSCVKAKENELATLPTPTYPQGQTISPTIIASIVASVPPLIVASATPFSAVTALVPSQGQAVSSPTPIDTTFPPSFETGRDETMAQTAVSHQAEFVWLNSANTTLWRYVENLLNHPIALDVYQEKAYLLDNGQVLAIDLTIPILPELLLAPDDVVEGVRVLEPLDLAVVADGLLVLDRAGDVYLYDWAIQEWRLDRYDRPIGDSSGHYYVSVTEAVNGRYLLEANYHYVRRYGNDNRDRLWNLPEQFAVDVAAWKNSVYVLSQAARTRQGTLTLYQETRLISTFAPPVEIVQPRQLAVTETAVYILDMAGKRLLALDKVSGTLQQVVQMPPDVSAIWVDSANDRLIMAGRDGIYFNGRLSAQSATIQANIQNAHLLSAVQPTQFAQLQNLISPIGGTALTQRDLQMPGAARHYRYGVHEGVDFYWRRGTAVRAIAAGIVVRATVEYKRPFVIEFDQYRTQSQQLGYTSPEALDFYRGIQIWIQHEDGTVSRYAHLSNIAPAIIEGVFVEQGQLLGEVGNSGSPSSIDSETADAHLHFELWQGDYFLGQYLRPIEARELLEGLFTNNLSR